ncbi:MAG: hypothetical protein JXQ79_06075 [Rhodobacteraceae bacterium]|nr:hypothetical protein [Paracoccaceae bacterium]
MTLTFPNPRPVPMALEQARDVVANPSIYHSHDLRREAWAVLKSARGQRVIQHRLPRTPGPLGAA